jgi:hypothetical protein
LQGDTRFLQCQIRLKVCDEGATLNSTPRRPPLWRAASVGIRTDSH